MKSDYSGRINKMNQNRKLNIALLINGFESAQNSDPAVETVEKALINLGHYAERIQFVNAVEVCNSVQAFNPDIVFNLFQNASENVNTNMHLMCLIELLGFPFIGPLPFIIGLSTKKNFIKRLLENKRIPSIPYQIYRDTPKSTYLDFPVILRPANMDWPSSMIQENVIADINKLKVEVSEYLKKCHQPILVETFIPGKIFFVGVFGNRNPKILPVCEAVINKNKYSYQCPADIKWELGYQLRDTALHVYRYFMGKDYALVSFLIDPSHHVYVADYHPNPSFAPDSIFQKGFEASEYDFNEFLQLIIDETLEKEELAKK